ncbi:proline-rich domain-containing protein [Lyngbya sp. CCY1209]|uniref:proline-rich domain-containing protein n=1 Tax=Lyngbya sp. CCY1209 TaxID=2886103 RepID=UPI002D20D062|nr:proline-rich domain-containing protein [Lyngbya sp. CCY1209]MEB3883451.1 MFS transporter [Lyngbya sp. CCY1209]
MDAESGLTGLRRTAIAVFVLLGTIIFYGYEFASANLRNQLPAVEFLLDPTLYPRDFYVREMVQFNPRFYYYHLIEVLSRLGLNISAITFIYYLIALAAFVLGLSAIARILCRNVMAASTLAFLGLTAANGTIGFTDLFRTEPIPATFAIAVSIWGIYHCFKSRWIFGYTLFGCACLLQFLVGVLPGILFAPLAILEVYRSSHVDRQERPIQSPPYQGGFRGMETPPYQGGFRGMETPPSQGGFRGMETPPYQGGFRGMETPPYQGGLRGSETPPSQGGFRGSESPPSQGGFRGISSAYKSPLIAFLLLTLFAAGVYLPMKLTGGTGSELMDDGQFIELYGYIRHPHHVIYSKFGLFGSRGWINWIGFAVSGWILISISSVFTSKDKFKLRVIFIAALGGLLLGYVFVEIIPIATFAKLQLARTTPFIQLVVLMAIAAWVSQSYRSGNLPLGCLLIALTVIKNSGILLAIATITLWLYPRYLSKLKNRWIYFSIVILMLILSILLCSYFGAIFTLLFVASIQRIQIPSQKLNWIDYGSIFLLLLTFLLNYHYDLFLFGTLFFPAIAPLPRFPKLLKVALLSILIIVGASWMPNRLKIVAKPDEPVAILGERFRQQSPQDALVLVPPSDEDFRFYSQRSVVWSFKSFPFTDRGILEWEDRMKKITGTVDASAADLDDRYRQKSGSELVAIAQSFQADYILTRTDWHPELPGTPVDTVENWGIWQISE